MNWYLFLLSLIWLAIGLTLLAIAWMIYPDNKYPFRFEDLWEKGGSKSEGDKKPEGK